MRGGRAMAHILLRLARLCVTHFEGCRVVQVGMVFSGLPSGSQKRDRTSWFLGLAMCADFCQC